MLSLSTAWNSHRHSDGAEIIDEILELGIKNVELNFSLTEKTVKEISERAGQKKVKISSLHNYCPIPKGIMQEEALPDVFSLSSINEDERRKAVDNTKNTISTAKKLSCGFVVLHCGRVEMEDKTRLLISLAQNNKTEDEEYKNTICEFIKERQTKAAPYLEQIIKSLAELAGYATSLGISLGLENRFYYREIPIKSELDTIFKKISAPALCYWHDVGHDYILSELGLTKKNEMLSNFGDRMCGIHLHNIKNLKDHHAPTDGDFDFSSLKPYIGKNTIKTIEAHKIATPEQIKDSVNYIRGLYGD